jgi:hypothetical protein
MAARALSCCASGFFIGHTRHKNRLPNNLVTRLFARTRRSYLRTHRRLSPITQYAEDPIFALQLRVTLSLYTNSARRLSCFTLLVYTNLS